MKRNIQWTAAVLAVAMLTGFGWTTYAEGHGNGRGRRAGGGCDAVSCEQEGAASACVRTRAGSDEAKGMCRRQRRGACGAAESCKTADSCRRRGGRGRNQAGACERAGSCHGKNACQKESEEDCEQRKGRRGGGKRAGRNQQSRDCDGCASKATCRR